MSSSAASWRYMLSKTMKDLVFTTCLSDTDIWMRATTKLNGFKNYYVRELNRSACQATLILAVYIIYILCVFLDCRMFSLVHRYLPTTGLTYSHMST